MRIKWLARCMAALPSGLQPRLGGRCFSILLGGLAGLNAGATYAANDIVASGQTNTAVSDVGSVSTVTTSTTRGANAFNSFARFSVDNDHTANLVLPNGTDNLINVVLDERSDINGVLNAIKNGTIGGNLYFANPRGIIVGANGVINAGALTLSTPVQSYADDFLDGGEAPSADDAMAFMMGDYDLATTGVITIDGRVNTTSDISVRAAQINVAGQLLSAADFLVQQPDFSDVVNTNGLQQGQELLIRDGRVAIVAGNVDLAARRDVNLNGAVVSARSVESGLTDNIEDAVSIGRSGDIKVSGRAITVTGSKLLSNTDTDAAAAPWQPGEITIAAKDGVFAGVQGDGLCSDGYEACVTVQGQSVVRADGPYARDILGDGTIKPFGRVSISAEAPSSVPFFVQEAGAKVLISGSRVLAPDIDILAKATSEPNALQELGAATPLPDLPFFNSDANTLAEWLSLPDGAIATISEVEADVTILNSEVDATSPGVFSDISIKAEADAAAAPTGTLGYARGDVEVSYAESEAIINVGPDTTISTRGDLKLEATSKTNANSGATGAADSSSVVFGVAYAHTKNTSKITTDATSNLQSGNALTISATGESELESSGEAKFEGDSNSVALAIGAGVVDSDIEVRIDGTVGSDSQTAESMAIQSSFMSKHDVKASSESNGVPSPPDPAQTEQQKQTADRVKSADGYAEAITGAYSDGLEGFIKPDGLIGTLYKGLTGKADADDPSSNSGTLNASGALSFTYTNNDVRTTIGTTAEISNTNALDIGAAIEDDPFFSAGTKSSSGKTAVGGALALGVFNNDAAAVVEANNDDSSQLSNVGDFSLAANVASKDRLPTVDSLGQSYLNFDTKNGQLDENILGSLTSWSDLYLKSFADKIESISNSFVTNDAAGGDGGIGASVGIGVAVIDNNATALMDGTVTANTVTVKADSTFSTANIMGSGIPEIKRPDLIPFVANRSDSGEPSDSGDGDSTSDGDSAAEQATAGVGAVAQAQDIELNAIALVGDNAVVTTTGTITENVKDEKGRDRYILVDAMGAPVLDNGDKQYATYVGFDPVLAPPFGLEEGQQYVIEQTATATLGMAVEANTKFQALDVSIAGNKGSDNGVAGTVTLALADMNSVGVVSSGADIDVSGDLKVGAENDFLIFNASGGIAAGKTAGIGASVSVNDIDSNALAQIGALPQLDSDFELSFNDNGELLFGSPVTTQQFVIGGSTAVDAKSAGDIWAVTVAGGVASNSEGAPDADDSSSEVPEGESSSSSPSVAASGAVAINSINDNAFARVVNANLDTADVSVTASNEDLNINSLAGSGALGISSDSFAAGLAGALAYNSIGGVTEASVSDTTIIPQSGADLGSIDVVATGGGDINSAAGSVGVSFGNTGLAVAGAVTLNNLTERQVRAQVDSSVINAANLQVSATNSGTINSLAGAVAFTSGRGASVGGSVAVNRVAGDENSSGEWEGSAVNASISGAGTNVTTTENTVVSASGDAAITTIAVAGGVSLGGGSLAGSVAVNDIATQTYAGINQGSTVSADGNVGVLATADDDITAYGGAAGIGKFAGVGVGTVVSTIDSETIAAIEGGDTSVSARASSADAADLQVRWGYPGGRATESVAQEDGRDSTDERQELDLAGQKLAQASTGLIVNASATQQIDVLSVSGGVGAAGAAAQVNVNIIGGEATARVDGATLNAALDPGQSATVDVAASNHAFADGTSGAISIGAGFGAAADAPVFSRNTYAEIVNATIENVTTLDVAAGSSQFVDSTAVAGATGVGGAVSYAKFNGETTADIINTDVTADDVAVRADGNNDLTQVVGAIGAAGTGVGLSLAGTENNSVTRASVNGGNTQIGNSLDVAANSATISDHFALSAGIGSTGAAGMVSVNLLTSETEASVSDVSLGTAANPLANVGIRASDSLIVDSSVTGGAAGGVALGAAITYADVKNRVVANLDGSALQADAVTIDAQSNRTVDALAFTGGAAGVAAVGFGLAITNIGDDQTVDESDLDDNSKDLLDDAEDVLADANDAANQDNLASTSGDDEFSYSANQQVAYDARGTSCLPGATGCSGRPLFETAATVTDSTIAGAAVVDITAADLSIAETQVGSLQVGAGAAVGAGLAFTNVQNNVLAGTNAGTVIADAGNVTISADIEAREGDKSNVEIEAIAGGLSLNVSLGGAFGYADVQNNVTASAGGSIQGRATGGSSLTVAASDETEVFVDTYGVTGGINAAAGASDADVVKQSTIAAETAAGADIRDFDLVSILAASMGPLRAESLGISGGLGLALNGSWSKVDDTVTVSARTGDGTVFDLNGGSLDLSATNLLDADTRAEGYSLAAINIGDATSEIVLDSDVRAEVGADNDIRNANRVAVTAGLSGSEGQSAYAFVQGGAASLLYGGVNNDAIIDDTANVIAHVGSNTSITDTGSLSIRATGSGYNEALAKSFNASFAISDVENLMKIDTDRTVYAGIAGRSAAADARIDVGRLTVVATADHANLARADTLSLGGVAALTDVDMQINDTSTVCAYVGDCAITINSTNTEVTDSGLASGSVAGPTVDADVFDVRARNAIGYDVALGVGAGSLFGGSGKTLAKTDVNTNAISKIGQGSSVTARDLWVTAETDVGKNLIQGPNVLWKSGAIISDKANADNDTTIRAISKVFVGDGADVQVNELLQPDPQGPGVFVLDARNRIRADDTVQTSNGAAVPETDGKSTITNKTNLADVSIGSDVNLESAGDIWLTSLVDAVFNARTEVQAFGVFSGDLTGNAKVESDSRTSVTIGSGSSVIGDGVVGLAAGAGFTRPVDIRNSEKLIASQLREKNISATAALDIVNSGLLPMSNDPEADASIGTRSIVDIEEGASIGARRDVFLLSQEGRTAASGTARVTEETVADELGNFFVSIFDDEASLIDVFTKQSIDDPANVIVNGSVTAGLGNRKELRFGRDFVAIGDDGAWLTAEQDRYGNDVADASQVQQRIDDMLADELLARPDDTIQYEIEYVEQRERLTDSIAQLEELIEIYDSDPDAQFAFALDKQRFEEELAQLEAAGGAGSIVPVIRVGDADATLADIFIEGGALEGAGVLTARSDALLSIVNDSPAWLEVNNLTIPNTNGGFVFLNGGEVRAPSDPRVTGSDLTFESRYGVNNDAATVQLPLLEVRSTFENDPGSLVYARPELDILGRLDNRRGDIEIENRSGSVSVTGSLDEFGFVQGAAIEGLAVNIFAGRNFTQTFSEGLTNIGGSPRDILEDAGVEPDSNPVPSQREECLGADDTCAPNAGVALGGDSARIAGNNIFINAEYLNINGLIQAGIADWEFVLTDEDQALIDAFVVEQDFDRYANVYDSWRDSSSHLISLPLDWDATTSGIEVDGVVLDNDSGFQLREAVRRVLDCVGTCDVELPDNATRPLVELFGLPEGATSVQFAQAAGPDEVGTLVINGNLPDVKLRLSQPFDRATGVGTIAAVYDYFDQQIALAPVDVEGGQLALTGRILSTGQGELRALDGLGRLSVTDGRSAAVAANKQYDFLLSDINVGSDVEGLIKITDTGYRAVNTPDDNFGAEFSIEGLVADLLRQRPDGLTAADQAFIDESLEASSPVTTRYTRIGDQIRFARSFSYQSAANGEGEPVLLEAPLSAGAPLTGRSTQYDPVRRTQLAWNTGSINHWTYQDVVEFTRVDDETFNIVPQNGVTNLDTRGDSSVYFNLTPFEPNADEGRGALKVFDDLSSAFYVPYSTRGDAGIDYQYISEPTTGDSTSGQWDRWDYDSQVDQAPEDWVWNDENRVWLKPCLQNPDACSNFDLITESTYYADVTFHNTASAGRVTQVEGQDTETTVDDVFCDSPGGPACSSLHSGVLRFTNLAKADYTIDITFSGYDYADLESNPLFSHGSNVFVNLENGGDVVIGGRIQNGLGNTWLETAGGAIEASGDRAVVSHNLMLQSTDGIGTNSVLQTDIQDRFADGQVLPGMLNAITAGAINIADNNGDVFVGLMQAGRDEGDELEFTAEGSILGGSEFSARGITLRAADQIGSVSAPVNIWSYENGLRADANGDINLVQQTGDLRIERVASTSGDVTLTVGDGAFVDFNGNATVDTRSIEQLENVWAEMNLQGDAALQVAGEAQQSIEAGRVRDYVNYWAVRDAQGSLDEDGNDLGEAYIAANPDEWARLSGLFDAQDAYDPDVLDYFTWTEIFDSSVPEDARQQWIAENPDYAASLTSRFGSLVADYFPVSYDYRLSEAEVAQLQETAEWSDSQLLYGLSRAALKEVTDTTVKVEDPNVIGRQVRLVSENGAIGTNLAPQTLTAAEARDLLSAAATSGLLSNEEREAWRLRLAAAERGDLILAIDAGNSDPDRIVLTVFEREDFDVDLRNESGAGSLVALAEDFVYVGSQTDLYIEQLESAGRTEVKTDQGIYVARPFDGVPHIVLRSGADSGSNSVTLEAGQGGIGGAADGETINIEINDGALTARASDDIGLAGNGTGIGIGSLFSLNGGISLTNNGDIFDADDDDASGGFIDVKARSVNLVALNGGDVGRAGQRLEIDGDQVALSGDNVVVNARVTDSLTVDAAQDVTIGTAGGAGAAVVVNAGGRIDVAGNTLIADTAYLSATDEINLLAAEIAASLQLEAEVIYAQVAHSAAGELLLIVTGPGGDSARAIEIDAASENAIRIQRLAALTADIDANTDALIVDSANIADGAAIRTNQVSVALIQSIDSINNAGVLVYGDGEEFSLDISGRRVVTNRFVIGFVDDVEVFQGRGAGAILVDDVNKAQRVSERNAQLDYSDHPDPARASDDERRDSELVIVDDTAPVPVNVQTISQAR